MDEPARAEDSLLALDLDARRARVHEVQLVLLVVVMEDSLRTGRVDDRVDTERVHAEALPDLAKAVIVAELVERAKAVSHQ